MNYSTPTNADLTFNVLAADSQEGRLSTDKVCLRQLIKTFLFI